MIFAEALKTMKGGRGVKLPSWGGYWWWDEESQTILMYTKDGGCMDIRETQNVEYTIQNILSDEWIVADGQNCPILGGEAAFSLVPSGICVILSAILGSESLFCWFN